MKIVNELPPNYEDICKAFPAVKGNNGIVFTWGDIIYVPGGSRILPGDLLAHEARHNNQQNIDDMTPERWWSLYLKDDKFRAQQELEAYQSQFRFARKRYSRSIFEPLLDRIAKDLAGPIYGSIYSVEEAKVFIRGAYT